MRTYTVKSAIAVDACPGIMAGVVVQAFVYVHCAVGACKAPALADGTSRPFFAHAPIMAGVGVAIFPIVASLATQFGRAFAVVIISKVDTFGFEEARA